MLTSFCIVYFIWANVANGEKCLFETRHVQESENCYKLFEEFGGVVLSIGKNQRCPVYKLLCKIDETKMLHPSAQEGLSGIKTDLHSNVYGGSVFQAPEMYPSHVSIYVHN